MPFNTQNKTTLIRGYLSDFLFAIKTWLTTVVLGSVVVSVLFSALITRKFDLFDLFFFTVFALSVSFVYSIPAFVLFYIAVRIINVQKLTILQKKGILLLLSIAEIFPCLYFFGNGLGLSILSVIVTGYTLVMASACFFYLLKPVRSATDHQ